MILKYPTIPIECAGHWSLASELLENAVDRWKSLGSHLSMQSLRVFLVENHEDTVRYIKLYLKQLGHEVFVAAEMETALREIPKSRCDVLISDIGLPDGDGWVLLERLGSNRPAFAIAISGYGTGNDQRKSRSAGYNSHLVKPFLPQALFTLLQEAAVAKGGAPVS
jgi:two-component system CheB/CheR fusion protein